MLPLLVFTTIVVLSGCGSVSHALRPDATSAVPLTSALDPATATSAEPPATSADPANTPATQTIVETPPPPAAIEPPTISITAWTDCDGTLTSETVAGAPASPATPEGTDGADGAPAALAQKPKDEATDEYDVEDYDPWEPFNEKMFEFNRKLDRYVLKPVATAYDKVMPDELQRMISNAYDNIRFVPRFVNSLLQRKWGGAGRELSRFLINSTAGIGGFWDIAKQEFHIEKSREDFGQTLGFYGVDAGPYLIVPFFEPFTVRDVIGYVIDGLMQPLNYFIPLFPEQIAMQAFDKVNERSLNLELFQGFEETVVDLYSAVRHAYLERRRTLIKE